MIYCALSSEARYHWTRNKSKWVYYIHAVVVTIRAEMDSEFTIQISWSSWFADILRIVKSSILCFNAVYLSLHIEMHCDMLKVQLDINFKHY